MKYPVLIARFLLGAPFVFFGLNSLFQWMEPPTEDMPEAALAFLDALTETGFMHELRSVSEIAGGAMVLSGVFLPLGLLILAPIAVHIVLYHAYLDSSGMPIALAIVALGVFLAFAYRRAFRGVFTSGMPRADRR